MTKKEKPERGNTAPPGPVNAIAPPFRRMLVPLDGSHLAEAVLPVVTRLADSCGATIVLMHLIERGAPTTVHGERHLTNPADAEAYLSDLAQRLVGPGRTIEHHTHEVPVGDVAKSIAAHVAEHGIDLIVLGTHGEGGIRDAIWGSIAQQTLQHSTVPVLLVRGGSPGQPSTFAPGTIMVPLDATAASEAALTAAVALAQCLDSKLRLLMVVATTDTVSGEQQATATFMPSATRAMLDAQVEQATAYLESLADSVRSLGVPTTTEVRRGNTVSELATDTGEHADGLIVVATHGRAGLQAIWSPSVAARLLKRARAPILLVPIVDAD
jgi:nucleotide-binding universal stress UspA family protein